LYPTYQVFDTGETIDVIETEVVDQEAVEEDLKRAQAEGEWLCGEDSKD